MFAGLLEIADILIKVMPLVVDGVEGAADVFFAGKAIYDNVKSEDRDATEAEVAEVRALYEPLEDDFFTDDERDDFQG